MSEKARERDKGTMREIKRKTGAYIHKYIYIWGERERDRVKTTLEKRERKRSRQIDRTIELPTLVNGCVKIHELRLAFVRGFNRNSEDSICRKQISIRRRAAAPVPNWAHLFKH